MADANKSVKKAIRRGKKGHFLKGEAPKSPGRPLGSISIKDRVRQYLENSPKDMEAYVKHFVEKNRELSWQMLEGRPTQDLTTKGEKLPTPIYGGQSVQGSGYDSDA